METMAASLPLRRRHRSWPEALKREIVAVSQAQGASVSAVARRYDVSTSLVFTWRKRLGAAAQPPRAPQLLPVMVVPDPPVATLPTTPADIIEIDLPRGYRLRVGRGVKGVALRLVLNALERR